MAVGNSAWAEIAEMSGKIQMNSSPCWKSSFWQIWAKLKKKKPSITFVFRFSLIENVASLRSTIQQSIQQHKWKLHLCTFMFSDGEGGEISDEYPLNCSWHKLSFALISFSVPEGRQPKKEKGCPSLTSLLISEKCNYLNMQRGSV